jgi:hypothetical protein
VSTGGLAELALCSGICAVIDRICLTGTLRGLDGLNGLYYGGMRDALAVEQADCVALLLEKDLDQHVVDADLLLAVRLHVEHGPLQHALEAERRFRVALFRVLQGSSGGESTDPGDPVVPA